MCPHPCGNPLPLGLFAFCAGMALLAGVALDWFALAEIRTAGVLLPGSVFPLELLAAVFASLCRDTAAGATR